MNLGVSFNKFYLVKAGAFAAYIVKIHVIFGVRVEGRKVNKKQTYMKTETCNANSILEPLTISAKCHKIFGLYNFELRYTVRFQSSFVFNDTVYPIIPYSLIINSWFNIFRTDGNLYIRGFQ